MKNASDVSADPVAQKLQQILLGLKKGAWPIDLQASDDFMRSLNLDSLDAVHLTVQMHELFGIEFGADPADVDALSSFGALTELIRHRATKGI